MARRNSKSAEHKAKHKRYETSGKRGRNKERRVRLDWRRSRAYKDDNKDCPQSLIDQIRR